MKKIVEQGRKEDRRKDDGPFLKAALSLTALTTLQSLPGKKVMFLGDGAWRDMFISLHPEDIRAQQS